MNRGVEPRKPMVEISALEIHAAAAALPSLELVVMYDGSAMVSHLAYWLGEAGHSMTLLLDPGSHPSDVMTSMMHAADAYVRPFSWEIWRRRVAFSPEERNEGVRPSLLIDLRDAAEATDAPAGDAGLASAHARSSRNAESFVAAILAAPRAVALAHVPSVPICAVVRAPALVGPTSTRKPLAATDPFSDEWLGLAERHGVLPVDQALIGALRLIAEVAAPDAPRGRKVYSWNVANRLPAEAFPVALKLSSRTCGWAQDEGDDENGDAVRLDDDRPTGVFSDDFEVSMALAQGKADPGGRDKSPRGSPWSSWMARMSDGCKIRAYSAGAYGGDLVVFVNALGMPVELLTPLAHELSSDFRILTWQSRDVPVQFDLENDDLSFDRHVADLADLLRSFEVERYHLVGWCLGAQIALEHASHTQGRVLSLTLVNGVFSYDGSPESQWQTNLRKTLAYVARSRTTARQACEALYGFRVPSRTGESSSIAYRACTSRNDLILGRATSQPMRNPESLYRYARLLEQCHGREARVRWESLPRQTLFVAGAKDNVAVAQSAAQACDRTGYAEYVELPEADHYVHYGEAAEIASLIQRNAARARVHGARVSGSLRQEPCK